MILGWLKIYVCQASTGHKQFRNNMGLKFFTMSPYRSSELTQEFESDLILLQTWIEKTFVVEICGNIFFLINSSFQLYKPFKGLIIHSRFHHLNGHKIRLRISKCFSNGIFPISTAEYEGNHRGRLSF